ncbi:MAG: helix-turn-helix transcriptional regulator [Parasutterella sp.]
MSPNPSYISIATTAKRLNKSIRTIWRWTNQKKAEGFPQPIKLSAGTTVLDFEELLRWEEKRKQALSCNYFSKNFPHN